METINNNELAIMFLPYSPLRKVIKTLLLDRTTEKNIIWATDEYSSISEYYRKDSQLTVESVLSIIGQELKPRVQRAKEQQIARTRAKAEVFTPSWICNEMISNFDRDWFNRENVFNIKKDASWERIKDKVIFDNEYKNKDWQSYVSARCLEITCGEAPFLCSRYDTTTGDYIETKDRIGILDRKLRIVTENTDNENDWLKYAIKAFESCFGYEYQGDNLFIARVNMLQTFIDYYKELWQKEPDIKYVKKIAEIVSWNLWQMDGFTNLPPFIASPMQTIQLSLFDFFEEKPKEEVNNNYSYCKIKLSSRTIIEFNDIKGDRKMKFDFVIGNPPYQDQGGSGGNNDAPIYQNFILGSKNLVKQSLSFVIPARWFSAGRDNLLADFRKYMMNNRHLKRMVVYSDSHELFYNVEIKGGVCFFVINNNYSGDCEYTFCENGEKHTSFRNLGEFEVIIRDPYKANIVSKVIKMIKKDDNVSSLISNDTPFGIPSNPRTSAKTYFPVYENKTNDHDILLYHIENLKRKVEYVSRDDIKKNSEFIDYDKVFIPGAGGSGNDSMILGKPELAPKQSVCSQSYLFAKFDTKIEAEHFLSYLKTKFLRILVSALKISQSAPQRVYRYVPIQDFTDKSDIDWSKSIREIDFQLYKKYGLNDDEINFIESHIKEME